MAYYDYYHNAPYWGTQQYQFLSPPMPSYQPQSTWGGLDYYRAHGGMNDNTIFDYAWSKVKNFIGGAGVGKAEAKHWHRRTYGGLGDIHQMLPADIGSAAAYEAWRVWKSHYNVYGLPLGDDRERQREALIGLACGEAAKLWHYTGRMSDKYGRLEASESAAATASRIFTESVALSEGGMYEAPLLSRRRSTASMRSLSRPRSTYGDYAYEEPYDDVYDNYEGYPGSAYAGSAYGGSAFDMQRGRRRSFSAVGTPAMITAGPGSYVNTPLPGTIAPTASYATSMSPSYAYSGTPYAGGGYPASVPGYAGSYMNPSSGMTIIESPSRRHSHRHRRHRSKSRRRSHGGGSVYVTSEPGLGYY